MTNLAETGLNWLAENVGAAPTTSFASFNVFSTLLKPDDEVRLHSRFIHCLLEPTGKHGLGETFLSLFLKMLSEASGGELAIPRASSDWRARKEYPCPRGRIDLVLFGPGTAIAIENKLNAVEQTEQLECYYDFVAHRAAVCHGVFYLTKNGKKGTTHGKKPYYCISYEKHITAWIRSCIEIACSHPEVEMALSQYLSVVQHVVGNTTETQHMSEIKTLIKKHPALLAQRTAITNALEAVRRDLLEDLFGRIERRLAAKFSASYRPERPNFASVAEPTLLLAPSRGTPLSQLPGKLGVQFWVEEEALLVGWEVNPNDVDENARYRFQRLHKKLSESPPKDRDDPTKWWPMGWLNLVTSFNDSAIAKLCDADECDRFAEQVVADIDEEIKRMESFLAQ